jgi:hypothetical protein
MSEVGVPAVAVEPHPLLELGVFAVVWPAPLGSLPALEPGALGDGFEVDDRVRGAVRDLLRGHGFRPTGRSKPASEYLAAAAAEGRLRAIDRAVDLGNAVSLASGLPISVVDLDRLTPPLSVALAPAGARYVFNPAGQEIDVEGLLCLCDAEGPCANAVKDALRSKTGPDTVRTLCLVWGTRALEGRTARVVAGYRELVGRAGGRILEVSRTGR